MCGNLGLLLRIKQKKVNGARQRSQDAKGSPDEPLLQDVAQILCEMISSTEIRGGQAGGLSAFEFASEPDPSGPTVARVRAIARKRHPLAVDLKAQFERAFTRRRAYLHGRFLSVVGHTRFATGSQNTIPELHPHDWGNSGYEPAPAPLQCG